MAQPKRIRHPLSSLVQMHCSIVGTCLTLKETQKIARHFRYPDDLAPYQLHTWLVEACSKLPLVAKHVQKHLCQKYRLAMNRIDAFASEELGRAWKDALRQGETAGTYWAIITRLDTPADVLARIFGDVHMMSHLQGAETRDELKELEPLRRDNEALKEQVQRLSGQVEAVRKEREELKRLLAGKEAETLDLKRKLAGSEERLAALAAGRDLERLKKENRDLAMKLAQEQKSRERLERRLLQETVRQLPGITLPPKLKHPAAVNSLVSEEEACPLPPGERCPRFNNKFILIVGGLDRLEPHYRSLVENDFGARFLRHDGDCKNGQARLARMVKRAEAVICPIDCNSHSASLCVKKVCKDLNKPCVLLRNSGLGVLKRTLSRLGEELPTVDEESLVDANRNN
ncbi:MAG: DUF2325 domain-containing protein [Deltaproteobacteria bacterium]|nr:MAG: DUF2325 domain-containing protein [Deltaproteobacteria bacterium]